MFSSLVGASIFDPELRFINMVLSSAISNGMTYSSPRLQKHLTCTILTSGSVKAVCVCTHCTVS